MSVYKEPDRATYRYEFWFHGRRHRGSTSQTRREDAELVEARLKLQLRQTRGGLTPPPPAPRFAEWAGVYFEYVRTRQRPRVKRPERIDELLRVVLRFWGARPADSAKVETGAPYRDLTLTDPIDDPGLILAFEDWIRARGVQAGTRNHYLTTMSRLYAVAMLPEYRKVTGVTLNPFAGVPRDETASRTVALTPDQVRAWIAAASYHVRLAIAIAALCPALRLQNVLSLTWPHVELLPEPQRVEGADGRLHQVHGWIRVAGEDRKSGAAMVSPINAQLHAILLDARRRRPPGGPVHVVTYRGRPLKSIRAGLRAAAADAGIPYGRGRLDGATFHTLRHTASTIFARLKTPPWQHKEAMGWADLETALTYTHLEPSEQAEPLARLSETLPVADVVMQAHRRARRLTTRAGGHPGGRGLQSLQIAEENGTRPRTPLKLIGRPFKRKQA